MLLHVTADGFLHHGARRYRCALGRGGIRAQKVEGDGITPSGRYPLRRLLYRADRLAQPVSQLAMAKIRPDDGWCDAPTTGPSPCPMGPARKVCGGPTASTIWW